MYKLSAIAVLAQLLLAASAQAHFVFIESEKTADGYKVVAGFGEPSGFDTDLAGNIKQAKYFTVDAAGNKTPLTMTLDEQNGVYTAVVTDAKVHAVVADCLYGVIARGGEPFFLRYSARHVLGGPKTWTDTPTKDLRMEVVAQAAKDGVLLTVYYDQKPAPGVEIKGYSPADKVADLKTDEAGQVLWPVTAAGKYALYARQTVPQSGTHDGKEYKSVRDYATLIFTLEEK